MKVIGQDESFSPYILPAFLGMLFPALFLGVLRVEIRDLRHELATNIQHEQVLREERDQLTVRLEELRNLRKLSELALERGFGQPERVIDLRGAGGNALR